MPNLKHVNIRIHYDCQPLLYERLELLNVNIILLDLAKLQIKFSGENRTRNHLEDRLTNPSGTLFQNL